MRDEQNSHARLALWLGGIVAAALALFLLTGGELGGTKRVASDEDLPQIASPTRSSDNVGSR